MPAFYSIIFASLRKVTQEKVSIGLVLFDDDRVLCKFSHTKLNGLKHLLSKDDFKVVQESVLVMENKMKKSGEMLSYNSHRLFKVVDPSFTVDYVNYLSRYKNNLVTYTEPKQIDIEVTEENTIKLFAKMIGKERLPEYGVVKITPIDDFRMQFYPKIVNHFISDHTITFADVPNLIVPVKVDLIGKNGVDVFVQSIDMTAQQNHIINEISTFYLLKDTYLKNGIPCKDFVLTQEPPKEYQKQHSIWNQLKESSEFNYVDISEGGKIIEYAEQFNVVPVFGERDERNTTGNEDDLPF